MKKERVRMFKKEVDIKRGEKRKREIIETRAKR